MFFLKKNMKDGKAGGRETGCFIRARALFAVIFSILYPPLKISFTEVLVCIFNRRFFESQVLRFKSRKIECHSTQFASRILIVSPGSGNKNTSQCFIYTHWDSEGDCCCV